MKATHARSCDGDSHGLSPPGDRRERGISRSFCWTVHAYYPPQRPAVVHRADGSPEQPRRPAAVARTVQPIRGRHGKRILSRRHTIGVVMGVFILAMWLRAIGWVLPPTTGTCSTGRNGADGADAGNGALEPKP